MDLYAAGYKDAADGLLFALAERRATQDSVIYPRSVVIAPASPEATRVVPQVPGAVVPPELDKDEVEATREEVIAPERSTGETHEE